MTLLGLDFDNTLVRYDNLFHQLALEKDLIDETLVADKTVIRDYLRSQGQDEEFTLLQGEVYGLRILEAEPAEGMLDSLFKLHKSGCDMVLVSHKTKTPYKGPAYDLHKAAMSWLEQYGFFADYGLDWSRDQVFFEESKLNKANRIAALNCTHYIDDLPEILSLLPCDNISKILYNPNSNYDNHNYLNLTSWTEIDKLLP